MIPPRHDPGTERCLLSHGDGPRGPGMGWNAVPGQAAGRRGGEEGTGRRGGGGGKRVFSSSPPGRDVFPINNCEVPNEI